MIVYDAEVNDLRAMTLHRDSLLPQNIVEAMKNDAVGHRLKMLRLALGLSPSQMADTLGIERTYWSRFENGRQGLSDTVAALLCVRFGVTLDWIVLGDWSKLPLDLSEKIRSVQPK